MELQGPEQYQEPFARELLRFNRGGIVSRCLALSFLDTIRLPAFADNRCHHTDLD